MIEFIAEVSTKNTWSSIPTRSYLDHCCISHRANMLGTGSKHFPACLGSPRSTWTKKSFFFILNAIYRPSTSDILCVQVGFCEISCLVCFDACCSQSKILRYTQKTLRIFLKTILSNRKHTSNLAPHQKQ